MTSNNFINAEIPVSNRRESELAAKRAAELGYSFDSSSQYLNLHNYLTLFSDGVCRFYSLASKDNPIISLSEFLNQIRTETITLENGEKWRVKLIERVQEEPMSAEEFFHSKGGVINAPNWMVVMEAYAKYRLEFEREKQSQ